MSDDRDLPAATPGSGDTPWPALARLTPARVALGRAGDSLPTRALLSLALDLARARDALVSPCDVAGLVGRLAEAGLPAVVARSQAADLRTHLLRPDRGRRLDAEGRAAVAALAAGLPGGCDLVCVVSDGLSAPAAERHAPAVLAALLPRLAAQGWALAPVVVVPRGRVAISDEIGALVGARLALILLGERPGLSAAESLGAYLVHAPRPGRTDAERNCVSNIHPAGLPPAAAAEALAWLLGEARRRGTSGVALKDERGAPGLQAPRGP